MGRNTKMREKAPRMNKKIWLQQPKNTIKKQLPGDNRLQMRI